MISRSNFDRSALPLARGFYEDECGKLSRPSRGWVRSRCPLHGGDNPTSFSANLATGAFFCHSCGAKGGDVVAFVRLRYGLGFVDACKRLGAWRGDRGISAAAFRELKRHREQQNRRVQTVEEMIRELRNSYRTEINCLELAYSNVSECMNHADITPEELESCWSALASIPDQLRAAIAAYYILSFATVGERIDFVAHPEQRAAAIQAVIDRGTVHDDGTEVDFSIGWSADGEGHGMELSFP